MSGGEGKGSHTVVQIDVAEKGYVNSIDQVSGRMRVGGGSDRAMTWECGALKGEYRLEAMYLCKQKKRGWFRAVK